MDEITVEIYHHETKALCTRMVVERGSTMATVKAKIQKEMKEEGVLVVVDEQELGSNVLMLLYLPKTLIFTGALSSTSIPTAHSSTPVKSGPSIASRVMGGARTLARAPVTLVQVPVVGAMSLVTHKENKDEKEEKKDEEAYKEERREKKEKKKEKDKEKEKSEHKEVKGSGSMVRSASINKVSNSPVTVVQNPLQKQQSIGKAPTRNIARTTSDTSNPAKPNSELSSQPLASSPALNTNQRSITPQKRETSSNLKQITPPPHVEQNAHRHRAIAKSMTFKDLQMGASTTDDMVFSPRQKEAVAQLQRSKSEKNLHSWDLEDSFMKIQISNRTLNALRAGSCSKEFLPSSLSRSNSESSASGDSPLPLLPRVPSLLLPSSQLSARGSPSGSESSSSHDHELPLKASEDDKKATEELTKRDGDLVIRNNEVIAASVDQLLNLLVGKNQLPQEYIDEFLTTYHYIMPASKLLDSLFLKFDSYLQETGEWKHVLRLKVITVIRRWVEAHFYDFEKDESLFNKLMDFIDHAISTSQGTNLSKWGEKLKLFVHEQVNNNMINKFPTVYLPMMHRDEQLKGKEHIPGSVLVDWLSAHLHIPRQKAIIIGNQFTPSLFVPVNPTKEQFLRDSKDTFYHLKSLSKIKEKEKDKDKSKKDQPEAEKDSRPKSIGKFKSLDECSVMKIHPTELARQLTLIEYSYFSAIEVPELMFSNWKKDNKKELSPNVCKLIDHFNRVLRWIATEIITTPNTKQRRAVISRFLLIALECKKLNNYNAVMEIISALQSNYVQRLKQAWKGMQAKDILLFQELVDSMDFVHHFKKYREDIEKFELPVLPYIGLFLQDLLMIEEIPTKSKADPNLINFQKMHKFCLVIRKIQRFQSTRYNLKQITVIKQWLTEVASVMNEAELESSSRTAEVGSRET